MAPAYADIKRLLGDLDDHAIAEIEGSGITMSQLEEVAAHLAQETDVMSGLRKPLSGVTLEVYRLVGMQESQWEPDS